MSIGNSPEDDRPSIGRVLQQARIAAGLTVEEVSSSTRVRIPIVHAIEEDDFSRCGGDVYARGHIRTLARAVSIDPEPLVSQYDAEHGGRPAPTRRRRCSKPNGSVPIPVGPTGPRPWSRRSSPWSASSASPSSRVVTTAARPRRSRKVRRPTQPAPNPSPPRPPTPSPYRPTAPSPRPAGQGHGQAQRQSGQELDLRQGPQRAAALRRAAVAGPVQDLPGQGADRPRPR